jgi:amino acid permease
MTASDHSTEKQAATLTRALSLALALVTFYGLAVINGALIQIIMAVRVIRYWEKTMAAP